MNAYAKAITEAMTWLSQQADSVFVGQGVKYPGTFMSATLDGVEPQKRIEWPVAEDMQLGACIGMSLAGLKPISIYPRWNFLLLAANQLVNHLDKLKSLSAGGYAPKVIVRVGVGSKTPLDAGEQHNSSFTREFQSMCKNVRFITINAADEAMPAYQAAWASPQSHVVIELGELY